MVIAKSERFLLVLAFSISVLLSNASASHAHPHVFIDSWVTVVFDKKGLAGFNIRWAFDDMFSSMIIMDFDINQNGGFDTSEIKELKAGAFSNLKKFNYFIHVKLDKKPFVVKYVKDFRAEIKGDRLIYHFFVPCHVRAARQWKDIRISVYDREYYSDILPGKGHLKFKDQGTFEVRHHLRQNKEEAYFFEQIYPFEATIRFRTKDA